MNIQQNRHSFERNVFINKAKLMFKVANNLISQYICDLFQRRSDSVLNNIPSEIKTSSNLNAFSKNMVDWLFKPASNTA